MTSVLAIVDGSPRRRLLQQLQHAVGCGRLTEAGKYLRAYDGVRRHSAETGPVKDFIDQTLKDDRQAPRKQRHTAHRIWMRLREERPNHALGEATVREYVRLRKQQMGINGGELFVPQSYGLAQEGQVDWFEAAARLDGQLNDCSLPPTRATSAPYLNQYHHFAESLHLALNLVSKDAIIEYNLRCPFALYARTRGLRTSGSLTRPEVTPASNAACSRLTQGCLIMILNRILSSPQPKTGSSARTSKAGVRSSTETGSKNFSRGARLKIFLGVS